MRRSLLLPLAIWLAIVAGLIFFLGFVLPARADPVGAASGDGLTVTLYDEPCRLDGVTNLPFRATWQEAGEPAQEGCWAANRKMRTVATYWSDRTVIVISVDLFVRVGGA